MLLSVLITLAVFLPAAWLASVVENQTAGRIVLGDAQGTLWHGSAFIGAAGPETDGKDTFTPLLPGRMVWTLSPLVLIGRTDLRLENSLALSQPVSISGDWRTWTISASSIALPAEQLTALGAPWNTLQPSGQMVLTWQLLRLSLAAKQGADLHGLMTLALTAMASRLSPVKPLGSYRIGLDWQGQHAAIGVDTLSGPLLLDGKGMVNNGHVDFSGTAQAAQGQEEKLAGLLRFLGQPSRINGKDVIALAFKS